MPKIKDSIHIASLSKQFKGETKPALQDLTVIENLNFYAALHNLSEEEKPKVFERMLHFTALSPFTERLVGNLSGGMKQKLGLACSLLGRPKVLLLDEPSVGG